MAGVQFSTADPYEEWLKSEGIPVARGFHVEDVNTLELGHWPRMGGLGSYINIDGGAEIINAYVCEMPPGATLIPQRHLFEEVIYVLSGSGATAVWNEGGPKQTFEWGEGSLFAIPLNAWRQHFNGSGSRPARFLAVTNAPLVINFFRNLDFVFANPFVFQDRYSAEEDFWSGQGTHGWIGKRNIWETNFVPDIRNIGVPEFPIRGKVRRIFLEMALSNLASHVGEEPVGTYSKAHRHGPGVHILTLAGEGYTLLWLEGQEKTRLNWKPGSLFSPPSRWFHQHFTTSNVPERSLRIGFSKRFRLFRKLMPDTSMTSIKEGGDQIEYEDEEPEIRLMFETELARSGVRSAMYD